MFGPTEPEDFGGLSKGKLSYEDYYNEVRIKYVLGMGLMIRLQCEALVEKFNVTPLIVGVASTVWLRFLLSTGVFKDSWANDVLIDSEMQRPETTELSGNNYHSNFLLSTPLLSSISSLRFSIFLLVSSGY